MTKYECKELLRNFTASCVSFTVSNRNVEHPLSISCSVRYSRLALTG